MQLSILKVVSTTQLTMMHGDTFGQGLTTQTTAVITGNSTQDGIDLLEMVPNCTMEAVFLKGNAGQEVQVG